MKKILFVVLLTMLVGNVYAKKKEKDFVDGQYARNSISFIVVNHGDAYDAEVNDAVRTYVNEKFDFNDIDVKTVQTSVARQTDPKAARMKTPSADYIAGLLSEVDLGKSVFSYLFNRQENGVMNDSIILKRGMYNATDQDIMNAQATKLGLAAIADEGYKLINRSYVVVLDVYAVGDCEVNFMGETTMKKGISVFAVVYSMNLKESTLNKIFEECWIYDDDDENTVAEKNEIFDSIEIPMNERLSISELVLEDEQEPSSGGVEDLTAEVFDTRDNVIHKALDLILDNKKMEEWKVVTPILDNHPLTAKIGMKEGVKNGQRFTVYQYVEDKNGELGVKKRGNVRAANKIVDNRGVATGETLPTTFYQESGLIGVKAGMLMKENKDWKLSIGIGCKIGGGSIASLDINAGYLAWLNTFAGSRFAAYHYVLADYSAGANSVVAGYGCGLRFIRWLELMPYFKLGYGAQSFGVDGGLDVVFRITSPVNISVKMGGNSFNSSNTMPLYVAFGLRFNM